MTANLTITDTEVQAIRSAERYLSTIAHEDAFHPSRSVLADLETVNRMLSRLATAPPIEEVESNGQIECDERSPRPGDWAKDLAPPVKEVARGPSVVDRGRTEIEVRWAKETIGLVANELSRAYTEIEITRDGHTIPGGLGSIANRLNEAMQRLGLVNHGDLDSEIPF